MARIVKEHAVRRNEILDAAQRLIQTQGYEQMAIQDILDELRIAKGTLYHYFGSKQALLEAVVERILGQAEQIALPIVHDPHLSAIDKLQRIFETTGRWKTARIPFFMELIRVWYADDNALMRTKLHAMGLQRVTPLLTQIIRQGIAEGVLSTRYPEQAGNIVMSLVGALSDTLAGLLLADRSPPGGLTGVERTVAAYSDAVERVLGAPRGSLELIDRRGLEEWFPAPGDRAGRDAEVARQATAVSSTPRAEHGESRTWLKPNMAEHDGG